MNKTPTPPKLINIFRIGRHTDSGGIVVEFSEADLLATAQGYDAALHEAPLVIGHPSHDAPAYGWVETLSVENGVMRAHPKQVDVGFSDLVSQGRFKKVSASFYLPNSPRNPKPGIFYLRHVGFLGAQPPAVKGLGDAAFRDGEEGVVELEFGETELFHPNHDKDISMTKIKTAGDDSPPDPAQPKEEAAPTQTPPNPKVAPGQDAASYSEDPRIAELTRKLEEMETAAFKKDASAFTEGAVKEGKVLPSQIPGMVEFMNQLRDGEELNFSEGEVEKKVSSLDWFKGFISNLQQQVSFGEHAASKDQMDDTVVCYQEPVGFHASQEDKMFFARASALATKMRIPVIEAAKRLKGE